MKMKKQHKWLIAIVALIVVVLVGTYFYRHRFDKYEFTQEEQQASVGQAKTEGRKLVVYFSWPAQQEVDGTTSASRLTRDGRLYGNTEYVAGIISRQTGADLQRIETERTYPQTVSEILDDTKAEHNSGEHPKLRSHIANMDSYDIVFIGYPLWWYEMPMALYSFFDEYDLAGKTVVLFTTHGGNRFCRTLRTVQQLEPKAVIVQGPAIFDQEIDQAEEQVTKWLDEHGFQTLPPESD